MEVILLNYWKINLSLNHTIFILEDTVYSSFHVGRI